MALRSMLILFVLTSESFTLPQTRLRVSIPGDVTIGGLIAMYFPSEAGDCSMIGHTGGTEALEALLFSVDKINADKSFLPNITLGVKAFDTCGSEKAALNHVVKELVLGDVWNSRAGSCKNRSAIHPVIGVIGPTYSFEAVEITPFLNIFEIPLISFSATTPELSDKSRYKYFLRTVASDDNQVLAIVDLLVHFNWTYVSVLYSDETYGRNCYAGINNEAGKRGIYVANEKTAVPTIYDEDEYREIVQGILSDSMANVIVLFSIQSVLVPLLNELQKQVGNRALQLVGSETLGPVVNRESLKINKITERVIYFYLPTTHVDDFNEYFFNLSPNSNTRNPWFRDFFQKTINCSLQNNSTGGDETFKDFCYRNQTLGDANFSVFLDEFSFMPAVLDGVYALAHALHSILEDRCPDSRTCVDVNEIPGNQLLDVLHRQVFTSPTGHMVNFTNTGDVNGVYDVYYFGEMTERKNTKIGRCHGPQLTFFSSEWKTSFVPLISSCVKQCGADQIRLKDKDKPRECWGCQSCSEDAFPANETYCQKCHRGHLPDRNRRICIRITAKYFSLNGTGSFSYAAFFVVLLSMFGVLAVCFVAGVFVKFQNTPLVKASGRELSCLLLIGLFFSFLYSFLAITKPSPTNCFLLFVLNSLPFAISYVAVAVKNNRTYRIFNPDRKLTVRPTLVRPKAQIAVSLGLVFFQVLLLTTLVTLDHPRDGFIYPSLTEVHHICSVNYDQLILSQVYNAILLASCTYYGFKTRNIPRNFNEAKYIAFAMYGSCITGLAFTVMTIMVPRQSGAFDLVAITCFRNILMAGILLVCFFGPKIYIILWKPEENIKHTPAKNAPSSEQLRRVPEASSILLAGMLLVCCFGPKIYIILWKADENVKHTCTRPERRVPAQSRRI